MRPRLKRGIWIASIAVLSSCAASAVAFGPTVRAQVEAQAERRGMEASIGAVRPGWGRVWLEHVQLTIPEVPAVTVYLDLVEVDVTASLGAQSVAVHGGTVELHGPLPEVVRQLREWRAKRAAGTGGGTSGVAYSASGVHLIWREVAAGAQDSHAWGLRYRREADGREVLSADLVRAAHHGLGLEMRGPEVTIRRDAGGRVLERLTTESMSAALELESVLELFGSGSGAPAPQPAPAVAASPSVAASAPAAPPATAASLPSDAPRASGLRAQIQRMADAAQTVLPPNSELDLSGLRLDLAHAGQHLRFGPGRLQVSRGADELRVALLPGSQAQAAPLTLELRTPLGEGDVKVKVSGGPVSLGALGVQEGDMGLTDVATAEVRASLDFVLRADGSEVTFTGDAEASRLSLEQAWLAPRPLRGISIAWRGAGAAALDGSRLRVDDSQLDVGRVRLRLSGEVERGAEHVVARVEGGIPLASCQDMLDSIPDGLAPLLAGMRMSGTFTLDTKVQFDSRQVAETVVHWKAANECRVAAVPERIHPRRFRSTWTRRLRGADGRVTSVESGPGTPNWVPLHSVSPHMETAILVCEDARFTRHRGFDDEAIANSIRENLKAGSFVRGASTVSMQLAKNLYLPRQKTVSRKLQEAVLTVLLEQELTKSEILELYLNVIEFGPGVYGIGPAARHYFNSTADGLSIGQALYLASILPRPSQHHFGADGQVTPGWSDYLRRLMRIAYKIRRLTDEELEDALREQVAYGVPYSPPGPGDEEERDDSLVDMDDASPAPRLPMPEPPAF